MEKNITQISLVASCFHLYTLPEKVGKTTHYMATAIEGTTTELPSTLIIHPQDPTTDDLCPIYQDAGLTGRVTVVRGDVSRKELQELIASHDRVWMMGHGSAVGLMDREKAFDPTDPVVIDGSHAKLLREKGDSCIFLWCYAQDFVEPRELRGFYSGMFISELREADLLGLEGVTESHIETSNKVFADCMKTCVANSSAPEILQELKSGAYAELAQSNPVAAFNFERLFCA